MLWSDFHLTRNVMANHFTHVRTVCVVGPEHIVADSEAMAFTPGVRRKAQHLNLPDAIDIQLAACFGYSSVCASPALQLFCALEAVHVRGRTADIQNIPFEIRVMSQAFSFSVDRVAAAPGNGAPLMDSDRAKIALAITATVGRNGELDRLLSFNLALLLVIGMLDALEIERIDRPTQPEQLA